MIEARFLGTISGFANHAAVSAISSISASSATAVSATSAFRGVAAAPVARNAVRHISGTIPNNFYFSNTHHHQGTISAAAASSGVIVTVGGAMPGAAVSSHTPVATGGVTASTSAVSSAAAVFAAPHTSFVTTHSASRFIPLASSSAQKGPFSAGVIRSSNKSRSLNIAPIMTADGLTIRSARVSDADDIFQLLSEPMSRGAILPITRDMIAADIANYVICVDGSSIAGAACLKHHGNESAELCKICTSPLYQGRGIANQLVKQLINASYVIGKRYVFALTMEPAMARVFGKNNFINVERERLCSKWRQNYDMSRPSKAYYLPVYLDPFSGGASTSAMSSSNQIQQRQQYQQEKEQQEQEQSMKKLAALFSSFRSI